MKEEGRTRVGLGVPSMVLILLVLCLVLIGLLAFVSARADLNQGRRYAGLTAAYYRAAAEAQQALASLDEQMTSAYFESENEQTYREAYVQIRQADDTAVMWIDDDSAVMEFGAEEERMLVVEIEAEAWENASERRFRIVRHALEDRMEWEQEGDWLLMGIE